MPTPPVQNEGRGQRHSTQCDRGQNQQYDKLDLRQPSTTLADCHQQPVTMVTAVPPALPSVVSGHVSLESVSFPGWCDLQQRLTDGSGVARLANAAEAPDLVNAASTMEARPTAAVVQVDAAEASAEARRTHARETVHAVQAGGSVGTGPHQAVVHVGLAVLSGETSQAVTR